MIHWDNVGKPYILLQARGDLRPILWEFPLRMKSAEQCCYLFSWSPVTSLLNRCPFKFWHPGAKPWLTCPGYASTGVQLQLKDHRYPQPCFMGGNNLGYKATNCSVNRTHSSDHILPSKFIMSSPPLSDFLITYGVLMWKNRPFHPGPFAIS